MSADPPTGRTVHDGLFVGLETPSTAVYLGHALIVPDMQYAAILWTGAQRVHRHYTTAPAWREISRHLNSERDADAGLSGAPRALGPLVTYATGARISSIDRVSVVVTSHRMVRGQIDAQLRQLASAVPPR